MPTIMRPLKQKGCFHTWPGDVMAFRSFQG
jgi:hypothetical protein